jgi:N utilization substance protein B
MSATGHAFAERRRAARLAAVQALFQLEFSGRGADGVVREFLEHRLPEEGGDGVDREFFADLVTGVVSAQADVDKAVSAVLAKNWRLDRLDATARAILRAGGYEVLRRPDVPAAATIDEYVDIAHAFLDATQSGFINAALDALARKARPQEAREARA